MKKTGMKVLMLTDMFPSIEKPSSGVFIYELVRQLLSACQIDLIHPRFWYALGGRDEGTFLKKGFAWNSTTMCSTVRPRQFIPPRGDRLFVRGISFLLSIFPYVLRRRHMTSYDLVHAHMAVPAGFAGVFAGRILNTPVLITCHGSDIHTYPTYRFLGAMVSYALDHAQRVVFVSNALLETAKRVGLSYKKASVIHNGVDRTKFKPQDKTACRKCLGLETGGKIVLFIGNLLPVKGLSTLLSAFAYIAKKLDNIELICVGNGELEEELRRKASALNVARKVRFVGLVPHSQMPLWINACDVFCLPSISEGFPTVIPEVLSCGRPVVASRVGGIPEIITSSNQGILVSPRDKAGLSYALQRALESTWNDILISESAKEYSWEKIAAKYVDLYSTITD